ncbi:MAG TPA: hypothetical protein VF086_14750 [Propionibacteriaceae bacterium]
MTNSIGVAVILAAGDRRPAHPYIALAQSMPFAGIGHDGQEFFTYQARAFLDEIAGLIRLLARGHSPTGCETCGLRKPSSRARHLAPR